MLTTPITTPHFQSRVIAQLSNHLEALRSHPNVSPPSVSELSPVDTPLTPGEVISQLLAVASPWIDLCSPDPLVYDISRQVLELEIAYAAFCGIGNVIIPGPKLHHGKLHGEGVTQYAYVIQQALAIGNYIQIQIWLPMIDHFGADGEDVEGSLTPFAREDYVGAEEEVKLKKADIFGTWDAWNIIRSVCKHNVRLFVGKNKELYSLLLIPSCEGPHLHRSSYLTVDPEDQDEMSVGDQKLRYFFAFLTFKVQTTKTRS